MTHVVSIRLRDDQLDRLKRFARRLGKSQSELGAQLIEESMRASEFANIEFRDSVIGRQAFMRDSNLAVWEVILVAQDHSMDPTRVSDYFERPHAWVKSAFHYYEAYPNDIDPIIADNGSVTFDSLKRLLPNIERSTI